MFDINSIRQKIASATAYTKQVNDHLIADIDNDRSLIDHMVKSLKVLETTVINLRLNRNKCVRERSVSASRIMCRDNSFASSTTNMNNASKFDRPPKQSIARPYVSTNHQPLKIISPRVEALQTKINKMRSSSGSVLRGLNSQSGDVSTIVIQNNIKRLNYCLQTYDFSKPTTPGRSIGSQNTPLRSSNVKSYKSRLNVQAFDHSQDAMHATHDIGKIKDKADDADMSDNFRHRSSTIVNEASRLQHDRGDTPNNADRQHRATIQTGSGRLSHINALLSNTRLTVKDKTAVKRRTPSDLTKTSGKITVHSKTGQSKQSNSVVPALNLKLKKTGQIKKAV